MTIEKLEEFASNGDKHLTGLDVATGFPRADKPERPWFNKLFGDITSKTNELINYRNSDEETKLIASNGFITVDSFELGATITQRNQALRHTATGNLYRWAGDLPKVVPANSLPLTTGGFGSNGWLDVSDTVLRQELSTPYGALKIPSITLSLSSMAELVQLPVIARFNNKLYQINSYREGLMVGGGYFTWQPNKPKSEHNGGTIIDPDKTFPFNWQDKPSVVTWLTASNTGDGCFVSNTVGNLDVTRFGANPNFSLEEDAAIVINKAMSVVNNIYVPEGNYITHTPIVNTKNHCVLRGDGRNRTLITSYAARREPLIFDGVSYDTTVLSSKPEGVGGWILGGDIIDMTIVANGANGVVFNSVCNTQSIQDTEIRGADIGISTLNSWVHNYHNLYLRNCKTAGIKMKAAANSYSMTGVEIYCDDPLVYTDYGLWIEQDSYGNMFTGTIEHCKVGLRLKDKGQVSLTGTDFEICSTAFVESVNNGKVISTLSANTFVGAPSQAMFTVSNSELVLESNYSTAGSGNPPTGNLLYDLPLTSKVVANNNNWHAHTTIVSESNKDKIIGNDFGRYDFNKSVRSKDKKVLDVYAESSNVFIAVRSTTAAYSYTSALQKTQVGNLVNIVGSITIDGTALPAGDYVTILGSAVNAHASVSCIGSFLLSKTSDTGFRAGISGYITLVNGNWYLLNGATMALVTKAELNQSGNTLIALNLMYQDAEV